MAVGILKGAFHKTGIIMTLKMRISGVISLSDKDWWTMEYQW